MRNSTRLISDIEKCARDYRFDIKEVELEFPSLDRRDSVKWKVFGGCWSVEDYFHIRGLFQELRLRKIAEKTRRYFDSKGIKFCTYSSQSCDDLFA